MGARVSKKKKRRKEETRKREKQKAQHRAPPAWSPTAVLQSWAGIKKTGLKASDRFLRLKTASAVFLNSQAAYMDVLLRPPL